MCRMFTERCVNVLSRLITFSSAVTPFHFRRVERSTIKRASVQTLNYRANSQLALQPNALSEKPSVSDSALLYLRADQD